MPPPQPSIRRCIPLAVIVGLTMIALMISERASLSRQMSLLNGALLSSAEHQGQNNEPSIMAGKNLKDRLAIAKAEQRWFCDNISPLPLHPTWQLADPLLDFETSCGTDSKIAGVKTAVRDMYVYASIEGSEDVVSKSISDSGKWESSEACSFLRIMNNAVANGIVNPIFLDIGANIGWFSTVLSAYGFNVIAIDALRTNGLMFRETLCKNPALMDHVSFFNIGLSSEEQECEIVSLTSNVGDGTMKCDKGPNHHVAGSNYRSRQTVKLVPLDEFINQDIYLMKIDVEGFEPLVFLGAQNLFKNRRIRHIFTEVGPSMMASHGYSHVEFMKNLRENGFKCSRESFDGPYFDDNFEDLGYLRIVNIYCKLF